MDESPRNLRRWMNFAGCVLVVAVLYWTQVILMPLALAILLAFVLTPLVARLQRRIGRVASVLVTVVVTFALIGLAAWALTSQVTNLVSKLPAYRQTIREKVQDVREASQGGAIEAVQETIDDIQTQIEADDAEPGEPPVTPVVERRERSNGLGTIAGALAPLIEPLGMAGLVIVLVIFLLLERDGLRRRFIELVGRGNIAVTTKAIDEAGRRVSHQLRMQALVNAIYGLLAGIGLYFLGVPYAFLWGALGFLLRFAPYVGPWLAAACPTVIALAALPGWERPLGVAGMFVALELFTNLVLEAFLYANVAGVSPLALLIALAFWTWLWGPMGLLMGTPLTICVVVLGKHVPGLAFLSAFMAETSTLPPDLDFYQRLLAREPDEAADMLQLHVREHSAAQAFDALLVPALCYAERDRLQGRLSKEDEDELHAATAELVGDASAAVRAAATASSSGSADGATAGGERVTVLACPAQGASDVLALRMLGHLLESAPVALEVVAGPTLASEILADVLERGCGIVCIADLPPSPPSKTRYLVKKLRAAAPELKILVGRWAPEALADEQTQVLLDAGADHVAATLIETRDQILQLARLQATTLRIVPRDAPAGDASLLQPRRPPAGPPGLQPDASSSAV